MFKLEWWGRPHLSRASHAFRTALMDLHRGRAPPYRGRRANRLGRSRAWRRPDGAARLADRRSIRWARFAFPRFADRADRPGDDAAGCLRAVARDGRAQDRVARAEAVAAHALR